MKKQQKQPERMVVIKDEVIDYVDNQKIVEMRKQTVCNIEERTVYDQMTIVTEDGNKVKHLLFIVMERNNSLSVAMAKKAWQSDMQKEKRKV